MRPSTDSRSVNSHRARECSQSFSLIAYCLDMMGRIREGFECVSNLVISLIWVQLYTSPFQICKQIELEVAEDIQDKSESLIWTITEHHG